MRRRNRLSCGSSSMSATDAILDRSPGPSNPEKDPERVARGKLGGSKSGMQSPEWRSEIARRLLRRDRTFLVALEIEDAPRRLDRV